MFADALREHRLQAWVLWDFRGSNPVLHEILGGDLLGHTSRRLVLVVPAGGEPRLVCSVLDQPLLRHVDLPLAVYADRGGFVAALGRFDGQRVAMEVSPQDALPIVDLAPAGAVELMRSLGADVVSSAALLQAAVADWDGAAAASHHRAVAHVMELHALAREHARGSTEAGLAARILDAMARRGLETEGTPGVSTGAHSGDPHHEPADVPIAEDAVLLVDIWAREAGPRSVFGDVTWMSFTGPDPPGEVVAVLDVVAAARDAAIAAIGDGWGRVRGFELDRAARAVIEDAGYAHGLRHRTGHSLSPGRKVHGLGVNLDDTETHDDRVLTPAAGFTIEPGIYLPDFGVRLECNVHGGAPTTPLQTELTTV